MDAEREVAPAPKLPELPARRWLFSDPKDAPLCDWEGDGVCGGGQALLEVAKERDGFSDIFTQSSKQAARNEWNDKRQMQKHTDRK